MLRSLNTSATGMVAQQLNLDVIANNLANVNTTAFKHQRAEFQDLIYQTLQSGGTEVGQNLRTPGAIQFGLGAMNSATANDFTQGSAIPTGNPTDLMITGDGFFRVLLPDGTFAFTRDGSFKQDSNGLLVNSSGYPLQPAITIPANATEISISAEGRVSAKIGDQGTQTIEQITLAVFPNAAGLTRAGQNLWTESASSGAANLLVPGLDGTGVIQSKFLEGSNVSVVDEMVRMISAQRAYEINSKAIQASDDMLNVLNQLKR